MELHKEWIKYRSEGAELDAYLARPAHQEGPMPGVIVIQEIWGPDQHIQDMVDRFATAGYAAMAPDLYSRGGRPEHMSPDRIEAFKRFMDSVPTGAWHDQGQIQAALSRLPGDEGSRIGRTMGELFNPNRDMDRFAGDCASAAQHLQSQPYVRGQKVGTIGYCMGGALSALVASQMPDLGAAVIFYGTSPSPERAASIECPVYGFYGGDDHRISDSVPDFAKVMHTAGKEFAYRIYEGAPHAFFNDTRSSYHPDAARDAWARVLFFFAQNLVKTTRTANV